MSKIEEAKAVAINRRTFIKVSGMATGAAMLGGFHFVRRSHAAEGVIKLGFPAPLTGPYGAEAQDQQAGAELQLLKSTIREECWDAGWNSWSATISLSPTRRLGKRKS